MIPVVFSDPSDPGHPVSDYLPCGCWPRETSFCPLHGLAEEMLAALSEIAKGEGEFNRDPLTHATNVIQSHKNIGALIDKLVRMGLTR